MTFASVVSDTMTALAVVFIADLPFGIWLGRAIKRLQQISEVNTPSQLAHSQPGSISERAGKGDGFDHEPNNATEVGQ